MNNIYGCFFEIFLRVGIQVMDDYAYELIKDRKDTKAYTTSEDALSRFMKMEDKHGKPLFSDKELRDVIMNFLIAGRYEEDLSCKLVLLLYLIAMVLSVVVAEIQLPRP